MTPSILRAVGEALYGPRWQCELARELCVSDRTMRRWSAGTHEIPPAVRDDLLAIVARRRDELRALDRKLSK